MKFRKILITGGAGFIGSNFIRYMLKKYPRLEIVNLDKLTYSGNTENLKDVEKNSRYKFIKGDICDMEIVASLMKGCDAIIHCAAETHVDRSIKYAADFVRTNIFGTQVLLDNARKSRLTKFVHISSVTGDTPLLLCDDNNKVLLKPINFLNEKNFGKYKALTIDDKFKVTFLPITKFISHPVTEIYEILYENGGKIRTTGSHSVFVFTGEDLIKEKPVTELRRGDRLVAMLALNKNKFENGHEIVIKRIFDGYHTKRLEKSINSKSKLLQMLLDKPRTMEEIKKNNGISYYSIKDMVEKGWIAKQQFKYYITNKGKKELSQGMENIKYLIQRRFCNIPLDIERVEVTPDLMWLFGLYLAEGHLSHTKKERKRSLTKGVIVVVKDKQTLLKAKAILRNKFKYETSIVQRKDSSLCLPFGGIILYNIFSEWGFVAKNKTIPNWVWNLSKIHIEKLMEGFEGDAHIRRDKSRIFTSCNGSLIQNLIWLCRLKGINVRYNSRLCKNNKGLFQKRKPYDLEMHDLSVSSENYDINNKYWRTPHSKCIPVEPILGFTKSIREFKETRIQYKSNMVIGKERALSLLSISRELPSQKLLDLISSDIGIAKIRKICKINVMTNVYDIEIAGNNKFFGGNIPILLHNTDEVYGTIDKGSFTEESSLKPNSPYAASKAAADLLVRSYFVTYKLPVIIVRSCNNFGPRQFPEKIISLFITNVLENKKVPLYADGKNVREWLYVLDNCDAINFILNFGKIGEIYNVGSGNEMRNVDLTKRLLNILGKDKNLIKFVKDRPGHDKRYALNFEKLKRLGWRAKYSFEDALKETVLWYKENTRWWKKLKKRKEEKFW